jgi:hypothetical protein
MKQITFTTEGWRTLDDHTLLSESALDRLVEQLPGKPVFLNFDYSRVIGTVHQIFGENGGQGTLNMPDEEIEKLDWDKLQRKLGYAGTILREHVTETGERIIDEFETYGVSLLPK